MTRRSPCFVLPLLVTLLAAQEPMSARPDLRPLLDHVVYGAPGEVTEYGIVGVTAIDVVIPPLPSLVGQTWTVRCVPFGSGTCLGSPSFSDTIWFTVR